MSTHDEPNDGHSGERSRYASAIRRRSETEHRVEIPIRSHDTIREDQTTDEDVRFIEAFKVMRRAKRAVSEDNKVTVARRFKDALSRTESGL